MGEARTTTSEDHGQNDQPFMTLNHSSRRADLGKQPVVFELPAGELQRGHNLESAGCLEKVFCCL